MYYGTRAMVSRFGDLYVFYRIILKSLAYGQAYNCLFLDILLVPRILFARLKKA